MAVTALEPIDTPHSESKAQMIRIEALNPLTCYQDLIPFDQIKPRHFLPAFELLVQKVNLQLTLIEKQSSPCWETICLPLESLEEEIHGIVGPMIHLKMVMDSYELRQAWAEVEPLLTSLTLRIKQSEPLYQAFVKIREGEEWESLTSAQKRIVEGRLLQAKLSGIGLEKMKRERFNELISQLNELQSRYNANVLDAIKSFSLAIFDKKEMEGIPQSTLQLASHAYNLSKSEDDPLSSPEEGPWKLTLNPPIYLPVMRHCVSRDIRETLYKGQVQKASRGSYDNSRNLLQQLKLRKELAKLLEFENYAELSLAKKMAPNVKSAKNFLSDLRNASWEVGKQDLEEIKLFALSSGAVETLMPWDVSYWGVKLKENKFNLSEDVLKAYFPFPKVLEGLFDLCHTLFGITIEETKEPVPVWHKDVSYFLIKDDKGKEIAGFYLDPYSRPQTKRGGAWMDSCRNRFFSGEVKQTPIAYIVCNATPPFKAIPALFSFNEVETLFHEFGHALQHMLSEIDYPSISGINGIEWDAVEMVSQFMENWCFHPATLKKISSHYLTHEPMPDDLIEKIVATRTFQSGLDMLAQLKYGMTDLALHDTFDPESGVTPFEVWNEVCQITSPIPCLEEDRFLCSFHHIFGDDDYAAGYFSYKWAEVLSADAFRAFEEKGLEEENALRIVGERFKQTFLQLGGSVHPMDVFHLFRGRPPSIEPLLIHNGFRP